MMSSENMPIPDYQIPDSGLQFLASEDNLYDYRNLYSFAVWFKNTIEPFKVSEKRPLLIVADSSDQQVFTIAACWFLQIPFFPLSPAMTDPEIGNVLNKLSPSAVVADSETKARFRDLPVIQIPKEKLGMMKIVDESQFSSGHPENCLGYFLTSGSTGTPKVVPLKRRQILFGAHASAQNFKPDLNRYWLLCLPINHVGGVSIILRSLLYHSAVYRMDRFDADQVITFMSENTLFQAASLVPTMLNRLINASRFQIHKEFQAILLGGGPITPSLLEKFAQKGMPVVSSYGMTETCGQIAANPLLKPSGIYRPKKSVGGVFAPNEVQIRNEDSKVLPANEPGTIWLKGPQVFDGYFDKRQNKGKFDNDGWFNTGDYGYLNRYDQLFIETRRSDLIITGGENVIPLEVESALEDLEPVNEAVVVGVPDSEWGQKIIAFIIPASGEQPEEEILQAELKQKLSPFKIPKRIIPLDSYPLTASGKKDKLRLIHMYDKEYGQVQ